MRLIIFLDTGNTGRSVIAEKYAQRYLAQTRWTSMEVTSRATDVKDKERDPEAGAVAVLFPQGLDPTGHKAQQLSAEDARRSFLMVAVAEKNLTQACDLYPDYCSKVVLLSQFVGAGTWDIEDAYGSPFPVYQRVAQQLEKYVPRVLDHAHRMSHS